MRPNHSLQLDCGSPSALAPNNGAITLDAKDVTTYGGTATISCNAGFDMQGDVTSLTCLDSKHWTTHTAACIIKSMYCIKCFSSSSSSIIIN